MTGIAPDLGRLGRALERAQDAELEQVELTTLERLLEAPPALAQTSRPAKGRRRGAPARRWLLLSAAAAALLFVGWALVRPGVVTFVVGDAARTGATDEWLAASPSAPLPVRFSDGTTLTLSPRARARVVATSAHGAMVVVERGRIEADVVHRRGTRWSLRVGPYELRVHGTRFTAGWDAQAEQLRVDLVDGVLEVVGPGIEQGRMMVAGTRLEAHANDRRVALSQLPDAARASALPEADAAVDAARSPLDDAELQPLAAGSAAPSAGQGAAAPESGAAAPPGGGRHGGNGAGAPSWRRLFETGRHREALASARAEGFERLCTHSDAADLMALADTARFGGSPELATQALLALRGRFPSDSRASVAAFVLGSLAFDHTGGGGDATRWFQTYLAEQPKGALAREAMGRLLELAVRGGDGEVARSMAEQYLEAYPSGPHAAQARRALERP